MNKTSGGATTLPLRAPSTSFAPARSLARLGSQKERSDSEQMTSFSPPLSKKPRVGWVEDEDVAAPKPNSVADQFNGVDEYEGEEDTFSREGQELALVALIEHRTREVQHLHQRISYYKFQLDQAEKMLEDSKQQLARVRGQTNSAGKLSKENETKSVKEPSVESEPKSMKVERRAVSPVVLKESPLENQTHSRTELLIPAVNPKVSQPVKTTGSNAKPSVAKSNSFAFSNSKVKVEKSYMSTPAAAEVIEIEDKGTEKKTGQKELKELVPLVCCSSSAHSVNCYGSNHIFSQHKRKLRCLALCPVDDQLFVTSALDGMVNLWKIQSHGSNAALLSTTDTVSPKKRRWPEDVAWHPSGNSLFSTYSADDGDTQISILDLSKAEGGARLTHLEDKPHVKGLINSIEFMPWGDACFVTGGCDHGVIIWNQKDGNLWKPKALHRSLHSSAVMGVAGMQQKQIVLSAGGDKRIIGFDVQGGIADFRHQLDSKCMSVLPNPCDFNLFMVQTGAPEKQLRLFDIRLRQPEIHTFGFRQESSDSQSALINQAWSPDGLYISSGSVDPIIHIFDIRYNSHKPSQSVRAHQKRVFKAVWHSSLPLLISISSDLHIGLHKMT